MDEDSEISELQFGFAYQTVAERLKRGKTDVDSCVEVCTIIDESFPLVFDRFKQLGLPIACKPNCSWCCSIRVELLPHEAIAILRYIQTELPAEVRESVLAKIPANAKQIEGLTREQHRATNVECALLTDGKCSVYPVRPMQCAGHHSCDVAACEAGFRQPDKNTPSIPTLVPLQEIKGATISGASEALKVGKLKPQWVELHAALAALLRNPSHMAEWRSGRKLVKDAPELGPTLT